MKEILYFSATWCGPCKNFKPIMESVSASIPVQFVDVDQNPTLAAQYNIRSIPTLIFGFYDTLTLQFFYQMNYLFFRNN